MASYFFDSSILVKGFVAEEGSEWVRPILSSKSDIYISEITLVEVMAAFAKKQRTRWMISEQLVLVEAAFNAYIDTDRLRLLKPTTTTLRLAMSFPSRYGLKAYDSIQLATAAQLAKNRRKDGLTKPVFVTADKSLLKAARIYGLAVEEFNSAD